MSKSTPDVLYVLLTRQEIECIVDAYKLTSLMKSVVERAGMVMVDYDTLEMNGRDTTKATGFGLLEWEAAHICDTFRVGSGSHHQMQVAKKVWRVLNEFRNPLGTCPLPDASGDFIDRRWHKDLLKDWVYAP